jgi:hypothetical protein
MSTMMCQKCGEHPGTECWVGEGGILTWAHGISQQWCRVCVVTAQLDYARKAAENIPDLERQLDEAKGTA